MVLKINIMQRLKTHLIITISIYFIIYVLFSFVLWEIRNPFQWIIDIPTQDYYYRAFVASFVISYNIFMGMVVRNL